MTTTLSGPIDADRTLARTPRVVPLDQLSRRELEVLQLMAEGRSNSAIGDLLSVELKTVETHVGRVFSKLGLDEDRTENRRVVAALMYVGHGSAATLPQRA
jgi:DNA-binding NarL/FixJ family response regulator